MFRNWKKRYFVIDTNEVIGNASVKLLYYKDDKKDVLRGHAVINGFTQFEIPLVEHPPSAVRHCCYFTLRNGESYVLKLAAEKEEELTSWMKELTRVRDILKDPHVLSGDKDAKILINAPPAPPSPSPYEPVTAAMRPLEVKRSNSVLGGPAQQRRGSTVVIAFQQDRMTGLANRLMVMWAGYDEQNFLALLSDNIKFHVPMINQDLSGKQEVWSYRRALCEDAFGMPHQLSAFSVLPDNRTLICTLNVISKMTAQPVKTAQLCLVFDAKIAQIEEYTEDITFLSNEERVN